MISVGTEPMKETLPQRLRSYAGFLKLEHTLFSLPLLFAGAVLAGGGLPSWGLSFWILLAGTGARTLALSLNRVMDRRIDGKNPRTAGRELVTGALSVMDAWLLGAAGGAVYLWAADHINRFCLEWSWFPVLFFLMYPTLKRFTWLCHLGLGLTWALAPLAGWFAVRPGFEDSGPAWILALFSVFWLTGFDILYALQDETFDRAEGLFSFPARFGRRAALRASALCHLGAFLALGALYFVALEGVGPAFLVLFSGGLLAAEHFLADNVDLAFFKINVLTGFVVLIAVCWGIV
jgi:4-hydroxybenzoate polyprenyltransferase